MSSKSRIEQILLYGLGRESTLPPELSRIEELLVEYITSGGGGGSIDVDDEMSSTSTNPVQNRVIKEKFDALDGTGAGSIQQKIAFAIAEIVADAPQDFDTLKEIADWISSHEDSAADMNSAIQANAAAIEGKVDKVTGKGLSTEDFTTAEKTKLAGLSNYDDSTILAALDTKVNKVTGKGLSTEDFTTAEKTKLAGLSNYDDTALTSRVSALETTVGDINSVLEEVL